MLFSDGGEAENKASPPLPPLFHLGNNAAEVSRPMYTGARARKRGKVGELPLRARVEEERESPPKKKSLQFPQYILALETHSVGNPWPREKLTGKTGRSGNKIENDLPPSSPPLTLHLLPSCMLHLPQVQLRFDFPAKEAVILVSTKARVSFDTHKNTETLERSRPALLLGPRNIGFHGIAFDELSNYSPCLPRANFLDSGPLLQGLPPPPHAAYPMRRLVSFPEAAAAAEEVEK